MAANPSFDISTGVDLQEVDNAVNQAIKEIAGRYDFKGTHCTIELDREKATIALFADDDFKMDALLDVVRGRLIKRGVPTKNLTIGDPIAATGSAVRRVLTLAQGIPTEAAKKIQRAIKDGGFKKVQASIQGDELRVTSPSKDELQAVMAFLRAADFEVELQFGNYRG
jgi:cyclic-di-GMP-binding protein